MYDKMNSVSALFNSPALKQIETTLRLISEQSKIATLPLNEVTLATSVFMDNSALKQMTATSKLISEHLKIATLPLNELTLATSVFMDNSALKEMTATSKLISEQLKITTLPLNELTLATSAFMDNSALKQMTATLNLISEQVAPITESDITAFPQNLFKITDEEISIKYGSSIEMLEELRIEILNNKFQIEKLNQKIIELLEVVKTLNNNYIKNFILGLIVSIVFTYLINPTINYWINNLNLNKSQINKILFPEFKKVIKSDNLKNFRIVIAKPYLNVRTKPRMKSNIIFHLSTGDLVEVIDKKNNWTLIKKYDSEYETIIQGWVNTRYIFKIK